MPTPNTGVSDLTYNLTSVLCPVLQGAENYERYARDAEQENDSDLVSFFKEVRQ